MSDKDIGKKMAEEMDLGYFLDAYRYVTGEKLSMYSTHEEPDFVCQRANGTYVGIELTEADGDVQLARWNEFLYGTAESPPFQMLDRIYEAIGSKAAKRKNWDWHDDIILVLQLKYYSLENVVTMLTADLQQDFLSYSFVEIWIVDYSDLDAFGAVDTFCLKPLKWWGYHQRLDLPSKPYG